jgi:zinc protease
MILGRIGLAGRLGNNVRDKQGLAYHVSSSLDAGRTVSTWTAHAGVDPGNVDRTIESIQTELARLRNELVTETELADAKSFLTGSVPLALERNDGIADLLLSIEHHQLGLDYLEHYPKLVNAVTRGQILAAANKYLDESRLAIGVSGPA